MGLTEDLENALQEGRERISIVVLLNEYYAGRQKPQIFSLDQITGGHATRKVANAFGFKGGSPIEMRRNLSERGIFPADLLAYFPSEENSETRETAQKANEEKKQELEKIASYIIANLSTNGWSSFYFTLVNPQTLERNRKVFVATDAFQKYLKNP